MKSIVKQSSSKKAFTIIELLTVMSIIVILIGVLVPALNNVKRFATKVKQKAQFNSIASAMELFNSENDGYPPSGAVDGTGQPYCGSMKLCEAMMGRDLLGFHPDSVFRADGLDSTGTRQVYPANPSTNNLTARLRPLLQDNNANAYRLADIYGSGNTGSFSENIFVLCDVYTRNMRTGRKTGMPLLYYKADTSNYIHDPNQTPEPMNSNGNIYNYWDNQTLVALGKPWEQAGSTSQPHSLETIARFYRNTRNTQVTNVSRPYRPDSYILISAGFDGEYGTADDICNFDWKYRE
jgi:prepilin-type N-terminal cleavage/methylation domain-containing protein